jgi:hypothetical protein
VAVKVLGRGRPCAPAAVAVFVVVLALLGSTLSGAAPAGALAMTDEASPATLYVRPGGNDAADGRTAATAWRTLGQALRRVNPGQTAFVMNGTYHQPRCSYCGSHFRLAPGDRRVSARADAWIRVVAYPGHQPEILADRGTGIEVVGSFLELSGFRIRGHGFSAANNWGFGVMAEAGSHLVISNNIISGFPKSGISVLNASGVTITDNLVFDNAWWSSDADSGISLLWPRNRGVAPGGDGYHDRIVGNVVFGNENRVPTPRYAPPGLVSDGNGIIVDQTINSGYAGRILVMNNLAVNNGGKGINVHQSANVDVLHNTLYRNAFTANMHGTNADLAVTRSHDVSLVNNLVQARPDRAAFTHTQSQRLTAVGNVFSGGSIAGPLDRGFNTVTGSDVGFVRAALDPRVADFALQAGSIAIDRGTPRPLPTGVDQAGFPRVGGPGPDVGAHEWHPGRRERIHSAPIGPVPSAVPGSGCATRAPLDHQVCRLYWVALGRQPDPLGFAVWRERLASGWPVVTVAEHMIASPEGRARFGVVDHAGFVRALYRTALGRDPDPGGSGLWAAHLGGGASRAAVVAGLAESAEFTQRVGTVPAPPWWDSQVRRLYLAFFLREPDAEGAGRWSGELRRGVPLTAVAQSFTQSPEFAARYGRVADSDFIHLVYRNVLGREPDAHGFAQWSDALRRGVPRGEVVVRFSESVEFRLRTGTTP